MTYRNTLETKRLILRPLSMDDFAAVHSWASNPLNTRYMAWGPNDEEETRGFLNSVRSGKDFAVVLKPNGVVIGSCGIYPDEAGDAAELGWILHKDYWKRGYGTELGGELIRYGFEDLKLRRIFAPCAAVNYGSFRVMERNGMRREAIHAKSFWARVDKEWIDGAEYGILAEDYFAKAGRAVKFNSLIPELTVRDIETTKAFYVGILGFCIEYERSRDKFVFLSFGDSQMMFEQYHDSGWNIGDMKYPLGQGINFSIDVSGIEDFYNSVVATGITLFQELESVEYDCDGTIEKQRQFLLQDPDGYLLRFCE